jgi:hypothetical protein
VNRADVARGIAACEAMAKRLRAALTADAENEYTEQGTVPTWRLPGITVTGSTAHPSVAIVDEAAFVEWVAGRHPTEVETVVITRARPAWQKRFLDEVTGRGAACDAEGEVVPGLEWRPGGGFGGISLRVDSSTKALIRQHADEIVAGVRPLEFPTREVDA